MSTTLRPDRRNNILIRLKIARWTCCTREYVSRERGSLGTSSDFGMYVRATDSRVDKVCNHEQHWTWPTELRQRSLTMHAPALLKACSRPSREGLTCVRSSLIRAIKHRLSAVVVSNRTVPAQTTLVKWTLPVIVA